MRADINVNSHIGDSLAKAAYNRASIGDTPHVIDSIRASVAEPFDQVNDLIVKQLSSDVSMVESIGHYIVASGGKRLRPLLALLSGAALGGVDERDITFAAVVEFIHTATLLHDDVVDISTLRRGLPTANEKFGNAPSVLVGDFIYTRAFQLMVSLGHLGLLSHMADTTNAIAEGEVLQLVRAGDPNITEEQYLDVIERKTAVLFGAACRGPALLRDLPESLQNGLYRYGVKLGVAFQMIDDVLDYAGDPEQTGKQVGADLIEGKPTLPLIYVMRHGSASEQQLVTDAIVEKSDRHLDAVVAAVKSAGGIDYAKTCAVRYQQAALDGLNGLEPSPALTALQQLAELAVSREH